MPENQTGVVAGGPLVCEPDAVSSPNLVVADAMQAAWDDFVADTGCFPDCFELHGRKLSADFDRGNFHRFVTDWLIARGVNFDRAVTGANPNPAQRPLGAE